MKFKYLKTSFNQTLDFRASRMSKAMSRVWITEQEQCLLKFRATVSCLHAIAEELPAIYIPALSQWCARINLSLPPLAN